MSIMSISATEDVNSTLNIQESDMSQIDESNSLVSSEDNSPLSDESTDLKSKILNSKNGDKITISPGTYKIHNINITKNITIQGKGNPRDIIIDGENKSSIFLIRSPDVFVNFKNLTFINGLTDNFGGAISIETGHVTVDNCMFINNTALSDTNAGGISNYGTKENKGYLLVNNSLFINNHADHDGGAITTCYANSYIYNCVFINNSAHRDGGAIRVSVFAYGDVRDCIFMFNHADEWGGAYYSWSGESNIERCIFLNNTGGTNGGAVMVSGNINIEKSIIANNDGGETGGSFYIQQPMYNTKTVINVHDNLITNNTSPYGKEIYIKWKNADNLYTQFDNNDWGDEDPNDSSVIDPSNVTPRSKVSSTIKSNLYSILNVDLLTRYSDIIGKYFQNDSLNTLKKQFDDAKSAEQKNNPNKTNSNDKIQSDDITTDTNNSNVNANSNITSSKTITSTIENIIIGNSSVGDNKKAYEINETPSVSKASSLDIRYFISALAIVFLLPGVGYRRQQKKE